MRFVIILVYVYIYYISICWSFGMEFFFQIHLFVLLMDLMNGFYEYSN